ncbi:MAG: cytochrome c biogenesis protein CcdA [Thermodesulfobacteriota bacterium]|nr:cytochrome c biogenesis protein CcdA [Thermodesulfobacteriota bacterium]
MFETANVSFPMAFGAGLLSFLTPCILPLVPVYFTLITGLSLEDLTGADNAEIRRKVFFATIAYVLGFSTVFVLLGASASFLGGLVDANRSVLEIVGGVLIIVLGLHLTGIIRIPGLSVEKRAHIQKRPVHLLGAFVVGLAFAAGWTPCIGPILGSILFVAGNQETVARGIMLLSVYSAGLALPFIILSIFINFLLIFLKKANRVIKYINPLAGVLLLVVGLLLITGVI